MPGANFSCKIIEKKGITAISKNKLKNMEKIIEIYKRKTKVTKRET